MAINFAGYVFKDNGGVVNGATVELLETGTTTVEASTTTDSNGYWAFSEADQDRYDVKITSGTSVRYIRWNDEISLKEIDVRNNENNTTPAATFTNLTNNASNQVAVFSGANTTRADGDVIYLSYKLANSAGELTEFARMIVEAEDTHDGSEDGAIQFQVMRDGTLATVWEIKSTGDGDVDAPAMSFDLNMDSLTIGNGADTDISLTFDANTSDGVITWMEDEDYFKFSDEIFMNSTEKILFGDTATFIHQSSDGVMTIDGEATIDLNASTAVLVSNDLKLNSDSAVLGFGVDNDTTLTHTDGTGLTLNSTNKLTFGDTGTFIHQSSDGVLTITSDTTVDINGAVVFDGALTGITNITLSGTLSDGNYTFDTSGNVSGLGTVSSGTITTSGNIELGHASDTTLARSSSGDVTIEGNAIYRAGGTDVPVSDGGTGASSLTDGGVLLGSGTNAVTAMAVLADGEMIVGDGTTDPVAESGATLRTSIGVGTGNNVEFAEITGTTIDATTDFTIGTTVITDDSIVMTPSTSDTITIAGATNGALNITTVDDNAAAANIQITADGTAELAGTTVTLDSAGDIELEATNDINVPSDVGITFGDAGEKIEGDGSHLTIASSNQLKLNSVNEIHTIDGGDLFLDIAGGDIYIRDVSGPTTMAKISHVSSDLVIQSTVQDKDIIFKQNDGGTEGDVTALTLDGSAGGAAIFNSSITATELDISGNVDIDGTTNLDAVDIDGSVQIDGPVTIGVDGTGKDLKAYGDTAGSYMLWDESDDELVLKGANLVVGHTAPVLPGGATPVYNQIGTTQNTASMGITRYSANAAGVQLFISKSRNGTIGTNTHGDTNDQVGGLYFTHADGTNDNLALEVATIKAELEADTVSNKAFGRLTFWTANDSGSATERLRINKDGDVTGTHGTYHESSDVRLKENITTIPDALNKVESLRGVNFTWKDTEHKGSNLKMGFIAQEVEEVVPEVVHTQDDEMKTKAVEHQYITGLLVEAVKELSNKVKELEAK